MNIKKITSYLELRDMICSCEESKDWIEIENADVSSITGFQELFEGVRGISDLDLSRWDTSNVTDMSSMFQDSDFNAPIFFDTSKVTDMSYMFCNSLYNQPVGSLDTSNVVNMSCMFNNSPFNKICLFDMSSLEEACDMFNVDVYTKEIPQVLHLPRNFYKKEELVSLHCRNEHLYQYLHNKAADVNKLISKCHNSPSILLLIKNKSLQVLDIIKSGKAELKTTTPVLRM